MLRSRGPMMHEYKVEKLDTSWLNQVNDLQRKFSKTIGFLNWETLEEYLDKGGVIGAVGSDRNLLGYVLFANYHDRIRIAQLCVDDECRGRGIAKALFFAVREQSTSQYFIRLNCRRDFPASAFWPRLNFFPIGEKPAKSGNGKVITMWCYTLRNTDELGLWEEEASDSSVDAVVDAQIIFDGLEESSEKTIPSRSLVSDFLADSLTLWVTDEIFVEIDRNKSEAGRLKAQNYARGFNRVDYCQESFARLVGELSEFLPYTKDRERSDVHHIAKVGASSLSIFVTRDQLLLDYEDRIFNVTGVNVIHPTSLILKIHEGVSAESYSPSRVLGMQLSWQRLRPEHLHGQFLQDLRHNDESVGKLREKLLGWISNPESYVAQTLIDGVGNNLAVQVISKNRGERQISKFHRVVKEHRNEIVTRYLITEALARAVENRNTIVSFVASECSVRFRSILLSQDFVEAEGEFLKIVLPQVLSRNALIDKVGSLSPEVIASCRELEPWELQKMCAPVVLDDGFPFFLVPIKPSFATGMIDKLSAQEELFGSNLNVLLRWDNVYYKKLSHHKMLVPNGRIFWYVSGDIGEVIAVSALDDVVIDFPKNLFSEFKRYGILEWEDVFELCEGDIRKKLIALKFSQTFLFRNRIDLRELREIFALGEESLVLQSPSKVSNRSAKMIFERAFA